MSDVGLQVFPEENTITGKNSYNFTIFVNIILATVAVYSRYLIHTCLPRPHKMAKHLLTYENTGVSLA